MCPDQAAYGFKVDFTVPMKAVGKARPRFNSRTGIVFTPKTTSNAEKLIRNCAVKAMRDAHLTQTENPVAVSVDFIFEPPKSWSKKKREESMDRNLPMLSKPDVDNALKTVLDAMNPTPKLKNIIQDGFVYKDDKQVTEIHASKHYGICDQIHVTVWEIERYEQD